MLRIRFDVVTAEPVSVSVFIHDIAGNTVVRLFDSVVLPPGRFVALWEGRDQRGRSVEPGRYIVSYRGSELSALRKVRWPP